VRYRDLSGGSNHLTSGDSPPVTEMWGGPGVIPRVDVLGVGVSAVDPQSAVRVIREWVENGSRNFVCVRDVHGIIAAQRDPDLMRIHQSAGMVTPDGMPLVWCGRLAGASWMRRVYGPDLMLNVCKESEASGWRHFLYGAGEGVAEELAENLRSWLPDIDIVGTHTPPFRELNEEEAKEVASMINSARPDIVWVGLSTPKQERWMSRFRSMLDAPVLIGVGAAFDMHAGRVPQAPRWVQSSGFEWLFRLSVEPRRLWRRYVRVIPSFILQIALKPPRLMADASGLEVSGNGESREPGHSPQKQGG
jgi:N-acetylglucosaminyldiphosphoundecaprenol N-acetyl-beta-D-mannosaminyltransferase